VICIFDPHWFDSLILTMVRPFKFNTSLEHSLCDPWSMLMEKDLHNRSLACPSTSLLFNTSQSRGALVVAMLDSVARMAKSSARRNTSRRSFSFSRRHRPPTRKEKKISREWSTRDPNGITELGFRNKIRSHKLRRQEPIASHLQVCLCFQI
jgi:hypothetical protein